VEGEPNKSTMCKCPSIDVQNQVRFARLSAADLAIRGVSADHHFGCGQLTPEQKALVTLQELLTRHKDQIAMDSLGKSGNAAGPDFCLVGEICGSPISNRG
jgi:hypothetical protein